MREELDRSVRDLVYLLRCAIGGEAPDTSGLGDLERVYALASRHKLTAAVAMALESGGRGDSRSAQAIAAALRRRVLFDGAYAQVKAALEAAGIWFLPLKGSVLQGDYPKPGMREMADHDILFDEARAEDVKAIMEGLGFSMRSYGAGCHDAYVRPPVLNFELHRALFGPGHEASLRAYYGDIRPRLLGEGPEKHLSPEDFYLYITAHEYKHYSGGGTGLRSLADTWVYLGKHSLDMAYVAREAEKLGIADFEAANRGLAQRLFSGGKLTEEDRDMLDYILSSGTYGTIGHSVENQMRKHGWGRLRYALHRFSVPVGRKDPMYAAFAAAYPLFYRRRFLLPLLPFYRVLCSMRRGGFKAEARAIAGVR